MTDDLELGTIREHYARITPVMEELADVDGNLTIGLNDYSGWYVRRDQDDFELIEEGYDQEARCATLATDYATVQGRIERALYTVTTYKSRDAFVDWEPCTFEDGETKWRTSSPTPGYGDLRGVMAWGDIDLADDLKPQRGDLDEDTQQVIDETLEAYIDEYARLYGDRDAVFGLDSVGGSYIMGAPAATLPIAELFDEDADARERVMEAFVDRSNEWLKEAQDRVEDRVDGAAEVIDPDWVNNCNRQYKAPLSLHTDHDAVVVPLNTDAPSYELVPFSDVDDDLVEATASWAADLTDTEYRDHAETLVKRLWPDEYENHDGWEAALKSWAEAESEREERQEQARLRARQRRRERKEQMGSGFEGAPITPFREDVYDAIDRIDTADVVRKHASDAWNTGRDSNDKIEFDPSWRTSESGSSCFVDTANNSFGDSGMGGGGSAVEAIALGDPSINYSDPSDTLDGEEWRQAVNALRQAGHEIPYTPPTRTQSMAMAMSTSRCPTGPSGRPPSRWVWSPKRPSSGRSRIAAATSASPARRRTTTRSPPSRTPASNTVGSTCRQTGVAPKTWSRRRRTATGTHHQHLRRTHRTTVAPKFAALTRVTETTTAGRASTTSARTQSSIPTSVATATGTRTTTPARPTSSASPTSRSTWTRSSSTAATGSST